MQSQFENFATENIKQLGIHRQDVVELGDEERRYQSAIHIT